MQRFDWSRLWTALVVGALVAGIVTHAHAGPLTNTNISPTTFSSFAGVSVVPVLVSPYDFSGPAGVDGLVYSQVFTGIGSATGLFVYVYQIELFSGADVSLITSFSVPFITDPTSLSVGSINSFYIGTNPDGAQLIPPGASGTAGPSLSAWTANTTSFSFVGNPIEKGKFSYVFGTFSPLPPMIAYAGIANTGANVLLAPLAYVPSPEPSAIFLLVPGVALLGLLRRRQKA